MDFNDLADALPTLMCMFSALRWDSLLTNHRVYYMDLIYEFYENIYLEDKRKILHGSRKTNPRE